MTAQSWQTLMRPPAPLVEARLSLHWAAQLLAASADALVDHASDDSHTTLHWQAGVGGLVGNPLGRGFRVGLRFAPMALLVLDKDEVATAFILGGRRLEDARRWLAEQLSQKFEREVDVRLRDYEMPAHEVASGAAFAGNMTESLIELGRYYADADIALNELAGSDPQATPIETWPHHFDLGGIFVLDSSLPMGKAPQIGFGLSPGDVMIAEPYYYVTPWPIAPGATFARLAAGGQWHRNGYTGAILTASTIVAGGAGRQRERVAAFLHSAVEICRAMIPRHPGGSEAGMGVTF